MKKLILASMIATLMTGSIFASGFQLNEFGARSMSMGGAFTAIANDPSAIFINPAGISQIEGTQISFGSNIIKLKSEFRGILPSVTEYKLKDQTFTPVFLEVTHRLTDDLTFGFGVGNPFGLGTKWDDNWIGRYVTTEINIEIFSFTPVVAYKLLDNDGQFLSLSAGLSYNYADVDIKKNVNLSPFSQDGKVEISGNDGALGYTAGILYKPFKDLSIGASYKGQVKYEFDASTKRSAPEQLIAKLPIGKTEAKLTTPANLNVGIAYNVTPSLLVSADYQWVGWSSYDSLNMKFTDPSSLVKEAKSGRNYSDSYIIRLGAEYKVNSDIAVRGGLYYDKSPVSDEKLDPTLPDANRIGYNIGLGYKFSDKFRIDLAYLFLSLEERKITNSDINSSGISSGISPLNGIYNGTANLFSITFNYSL